MSNVIPFKKPKASEKHQGKTLCRSGFHKWKPDGGTRFDVKQGKLVTVFRCTRCGATESRLT
jgi:hypothetical protein